MEYLFGVEMQNGRVKWLFCKNFISKKKKTEWKTNSIWMLIEGKIYMD